MIEQSILAIVGPTGVGKTAYAIELAQAYGAELISADSRQVYIGMDIGTGKEVDRGDWVMVNDRKTLAVDGIFIHGLDVVEPSQDFSVADWCKLARLVIDEILDRGKYPIIVGGTGFYLDALQGKIATLGVESDIELRTELASSSVPELQARLAELDSGKLANMNTSDRQNPARLIRAIELARAPTVHRSPLTVDREMLKPVQHDESMHSLLPTPYSLRLLGLTMDRQALLTKVDRRIEGMIAQGLIDETRRLIEQYDDQSQAMTGIGYGEMTEYLRGHLKLDEAVRVIQQRTHDYIKRQYTWFAKQPVEWVAVDQDGWRDVADQAARLDAISRG